MTLLRDVRIEMVTPTGERVVALLGTVERDAVAEALETLREGADRARHQERLAEIRSAHQRATWSEV